jgi:hypothetical protein
VHGMTHPELVSLHDFHPYNPADTESRRNFGWAQTQCARRREYFRRVQTVIKVPFTTTAENTGKVACLNGNRRLGLPDSNQGKIAIR